MCNGPGWFEVGLDSHLLATGADVCIHRDDTDDIVLYCPSQDELDSTLKELGLYVG